MFVHYSPVTLINVKYVANIPESVKYLRFTNGMRNGGSGGGVIGRVKQ